VSALLTAVFVASVVGSLHCVGMCGGLVALCTGLGPDGARHTWLTHVAYNGGRLVTYVTLGVIAGAIGAALDAGGTLVGAQRVAAAVAGITMIAIGGAALLRASGVHMGCVRLPAWLDAAFRGGFRAVAGRPPVIRAGAVGLLTGLLPCGWLYAFVIVAAGTGSALAGAATMAAFWGGTVPILLAAGFGLQRLAAPLRRHVPTATAIALIAIGVVAVVGRMNTPLIAADTLLAAPVSLEQATEAARGLDASEMPCCGADPGAAPAEHVEHVGHVEH
jgi:sulfite exporter TauE/SafE